jgi:hypothetical protein
MLNCIINLFCFILCFIVTFESNVIRTSLSDTFVESGKAQLTCEYTTKNVENTLVPIDENLIEKTFWYKGNISINDLELDIEINKRNLKFNNLDQAKHEGYYSCSILLKNGQNIASKGFPIKIYKCNYFSYFNKFFIFVIS